MRNFESGKLKQLSSFSVGATTVVESDLKYLYESHENFSVFPTYGIIPALLRVMSSEHTDIIPNKTFDLSQVGPNKNFTTIGINERKII